MPIIINKSEAKNNSLINVSVPIYLLQGHCLDSNYRDWHDIHAILLCVPVMCELHDSIGRTSSYWLGGSNEIGARPGDADWFTPQNNIIPWKTPAQPPTLGEHHRHHRPPSSSQRPTITYRYNLIAVVSICERGKNVQSIHRLPRTRPLVVITNWLTVITLQKTQSLNSMQRVKSKSKVCNT